LSLVPELLGLDVEDVSPAPVVEPELPASDSVPVESVALVVVAPDDDGLAVTSSPDEEDDDGPAVGEVGEAESAVVEVAEVPLVPLSLPLPARGSLAVVPSPNPLADALSPGRGVFGGSSSRPGSSVPGFVACTVFGAASGSVSLPSGPAARDSGAPACGMYPPSITVEASSTCPGWICPTPSGECHGASLSCAIEGGPTRPATWLCAAVATGSVLGSPGTGPPSGPAPTPDGVTDAAVSVSVVSALVAALVLVCSLLVISFSLPTHAAVICTRRTELPACRTMTAV
jgi:hypothetical protein